MTSRPKYSNFSHLYIDLHFDLQQGSTSQLHDSFQKTGNFLNRNFENGNFGRGHFWKNFASKTD